MVTRYNTGQAVLIPAVIRSAREENGAVVYDVDFESWRGIPEDLVIVDERVSARAAFDKEMKNLSREIF